MTHYHFLSFTHLLFPFTHIVVIYHIFKHLAYSYNQSDNMILLTKLILTHISFIPQFLMFLCISFSKALIKFQSSKDSHPNTCTCTSVLLQFLQHTASHLNPLAASLSYKDCRVWKVTMHGMCSAMFKWQYVNSKLLGV